MTVDVKINYRGVEATFTVASNADAITLVKDFAADKVPSAESTPDAAGSHEIAATPDGVVRAILMGLRGSRASKVLSLMSGSETGLSDTRLRDALGGEDAKFGPIFANVSKVCKRENSTSAALFSVAKKRGQNGKIHYLYRMTQQAARMLKTIPDFDKVPDFGGF